MADRETCICVPIEPIRNQIQKKYLNIRCGEGIHEKTWNRYPCHLDEKTKCQKDHCDGKISFSSSIPARDINIITALFIRKEKKGYALINQTLRNLFKEGILKNVESVEKEVNSPSIPLPIKYNKNPPLPSHSFKNH